MEIHQRRVDTAIPRCWAKLSCVNSLRSYSAIFETQNSRPRIGPKIIPYAQALRHTSFLGRIHRRDLEDLLFVDRDLAYELLWNWVRTLSRRLRATNDKMTFLATTSKF